MAQIVLLEDHPITLDARGVWRHGTEPLHPRVATLFARHLVPLADGTYVIALGPARHPVEVADTAFFVRGIAALRTPAGALERVLLHVSDGAEEELVPETLMQSADDVLYCRLVRHGFSVPCRLRAADYHELARDAVLEGARGYLLMGGGRWPIEAYDPRVLPAH